MAKKLNSNNKALKKLLRSSKVRFLLVIFTVALLGAGWFTYRSFAQTTKEYTLLPNNLKLYSNGSYCRAQPSVDSSKNINVITLSCPKVNLNNSDAIALGTIQNKVFKTGVYKVCASIKGTGFIEVSFNSSKGLGQATSEYKDICSPSKRFDTTFDAVKMSVRARYPGTFASIANLRLIQTESLYTGTVYRDDRNQCTSKNPCNY